MAESSDSSGDERSPTVLTSRPNPFFNKTKRSKVVDDDEDSDTESSSDDDKAGDDNFNKYDDDDDDEDPLITALKKSKELPERSSPGDILSDVDIMDLSFCPVSNLVAHSTINGHLFFTKYANDNNELAGKMKVHKGDIRTIEFDNSGSNLISGGKDKSFNIIDVETRKVKFKAAHCHDEPLYKVKPINDNTIATGDEDGTVKLWDNRHSSMKKAVMEAKQFDDAVMDIYYDCNVDSKIFVASSGEGIIQSYNMAGKKPDMQSEVYEGEMNSMGVVHRNSKLVVGCGDGRLYMFQWKQFGYHSAEFPGHPDAINAIVPVTDNIVVTACEDGAIRAVHLYPHRFVGTIGHHDEGFPVERMDVSAEGDLIGSVSHDNKVKFWNITYLEDMDYNKTRKPYHQQKSKIRRKDNKMQRAKENEFQLPSSNRGNRKDFFKDIDA